MKYALFAVLILAGHAAASEAWELDRDKEGIKVYTREVEGSRYREFKGVTEMQTSLASAVGLLDDTSACQDWLHLCEESRVLDQKNWSERYIYQISDLPFPASTRDAIFHATITQSADREVLIELSSRPDYIPETDHVRIHDSHGAYLLQVIDDYTIRMTWTMYINPAGSLPAFLVNRLLTDIPFKSLLKFRDLVSREKYQVLEFQYNQEGQAIDLINRSW